MGFNRFLNRFVMSLQKSLGKIYESHNYGKSFELKKKNSKLNQSSVPKFRVFFFFCYK